MIVFCVDDLSVLLLLYPKYPEINPIYRFVFFLLVLDMAVVVVMVHNLIHIE